jgi:hypothetical protein
VAREVTTVIRSDLSGELVPEGKAVLVTIEYADGRRNKVELDAAEQEVADWAGRGREIKRRGRRPGTKNNPRDVGYAAASRRLSQ